MSTRPTGKVSENASPQGSTQSEPPTATEKGEVTELLLKWSSGNESALEQVTPLLYGELKRLAHHYMRDERKEPILQTTALVHEAYVKLVGLDMTWEGRSHFVAVSARLMRQILVDRARRRNADKRGGDRIEVPLDGSVAQTGPSDDPTLALHEALKDLGKLDVRKYRAIEMKYFGGASVAEIADVLRVGQRTVERDLRLGRAWLADAMGAALPL